MLPQMNPYLSWAELLGILRGHSIAGETENAGAGLAGQVSKMYGPKDRPERALGG